MLREYESLLVSSCYRIFFLPLHLYSGNIHTLSSPSPSLSITLFLLPHPQPVSPSLFLFLFLSRQHTHSNSHIRSHSLALPACLTVPVKRL